LRIPTGEEMLVNVRAISAGYYTQAATARQ
jgi:hypothetical protein